MSEPLVQRFPGTALRDIYLELPCRLWGVVWEETASEFVMSSHSRGPFSLFANFRIRDTPTFNIVSQGHEYYKALLC